MVVIIIRAAVSLVSKVVAGACLLFFLLERRCQQCQEPESYVTPPTPRLSGAAAQQSARLQHGTCLARSRILGNLHAQFLSHQFVVTKCTGTLQELDSLLNSTFQFNRLRGCSVAFGYLAVRRFLDKNDLMCVIRAHAVQEDGYYRHFEKALKKRDVGKPACAVQGCREVSRFLLKYSECFACLFEAVLSQPPSILLTFEVCKRFFLFPIVGFELFAVCFPPPIVPYWV